MQPELPARVPAALGSQLNLGRDATRVTALFRIALGLVFVAAFGSMLGQIAGLIGPQGISPAGELLEQARESLGTRAWLRVPCVFWLLGTSNAALRGVCVAGVLGGLALAAGVAPKPVVLLLWILYLSIMSVGDVFLGYQWDALLLETAFFSFFLFPSELRAKWKTPAIPAWPGVMMVRLLLFKLMFMSGLVKLLSGDENWRGLTALQFHYWTQPLPLRTAWYAHHGPALLHQLCVLVLFAIELGAPILIFGAAKARRVAFALLVALQVAIALTGNYGFFNVLAIALCLPLLDDALLEPVLKTSPIASRFAKLDLRVSLAAAVVCLPLAFGEAFAPGLIAGVLPRSVVREIRALSTFNSYGLFATMTTTRREIEVQGSVDGRIWRDYEFRYKPGPVEQAPRLALLHLPRLDWQMWFAGLGSCRGNPWILRFQQRLLEGSPDVNALLAKNPFPEKPPVFLRTPSFEYRFSDSGPAWWTRVSDEDYCPALSLDENGNLRAAELPE